ncbi:DUF4350 domain-containing protein [Micromonospora sp. WMMA1949]|uniref:DUF4350 domain-containing protein n=1 Tax=Micromonospora sp. WMMA1949 TaxID=3015162 RepID=UPI0022B73735|nr:DUF4350 domain-containing protein [Micromonospora sp. WMMA1949]MCZ7425581.1 DUF4350 domain-containing protein [Micromonospora sp. WMMA1949]
MTATVVPETTTTAAALSAPRRRTYRLLVPLGLAVLLIVTTLVLRAIDRPDADEPGFLSPVATDDDGASRLAEALRAQGVPVRRETDLAAALRTAGAEPSTLFVPAPALVHPDRLGGLTTLPPGSRLVLVEPSRRVLTELDTPIEPADRRWAARAVPPDAGGTPCRLPEAVRAGAAAIDLQRYAGPAEVDSCYGGALLRAPGRIEVVLAGASDPFRNDRIDEWGNEALATGLLGAGRPLVWLDLLEPVPAPTRPSWSAEPFTEEPTQGGSGRSERPDPPDRADPPRENPLWGAFPPWFWALLVQLALAGLLVVLWRARQLGPPVSEPLPVTVRAAETVRGRARLYRRAGARDTVAETLRAAALDRLVTWLNLPPDTPDDEVAARVAERAGADPERVAGLLYGPAPEKDRELLELARDLDALTRTLAPYPSEGDTR